MFATEIDSASPCDEDHAAFLFALQRAVTTARLMSVRLDQLVGFAKKHGIRLTFALGFKMGKKCEGRFQCALK